MTDSITAAEAEGRMAIAAGAFREWATADLWDEFVLLTDEAWDGREAPDGPRPDEWARREAIGLALVKRGATAADLMRGYPATNLGG